MGGLKKIIGVVLKIPLVLTFLASVATSVYLSVNNMYGVGYGASIFLGTCFIMYVIGETLLYLNNKNKK